MRLNNTTDCGRQNRFRRSISYSGNSATLYMLYSNGDIYATGANGSGQLGDNTSTTKSMFALVVGEHKFVAVSGGTDHALALKADGSCWAWGLGTSGRIGDNTVGSKSSPVSVVGGHSFVDISAGNASSLALKADGTCWAWGSNSSGMLADGTLTSRSSPVSVVGDHSFVAISAGGTNGLGLKADGTLWTWGQAASGQLGDDQIATDRSSPVSVVGNHSFVKAYYGGTANNSFGMALKADGSAWAWGLNGSGQLGDNTQTTKSSPVLVIGTYQMHSYSSISAGATHVAALKAGDGSAWGWGLGTSGQHGNSATTSRSSPVVTIPSYSFASVVAGAAHDVAIMSDGSSWAWGLNTSGQVGNDNLTNVSTPTLVYGTRQINSFSTVYGGGSTGPRHFLVKADGTAWGLGLGTSGEVGDGIAVTRSSPTSVAGSHLFSGITSGSTHVLAAKVDGTGWAWGDNTNGRLGINSVSAPNTPCEIMGTLLLFSFAALTVSDRMLAISSGQTCWGWGVNAAGILGDGTATTKSSPVSVLGAHSFASVHTVPTSGGNHNVALKADGTAWAWGEGILGQLGDNTLDTKSSPVSVVGNHSFVKIRGAITFSVALKADGTAWAWGSNTAGRLGDNTGTSRSSPVSVVGDHSFIDIATGSTHTCALKADGTCWAWGPATSGQLGDNQTAAARSSPVSVVGDHSFIRLGGTGSNFSLALKADGSAWSWGLATSGQLGDNTATTKSSPVSVVGAHSFVSISGGTNYVLALKANDGSAWAWGLGTSGQLGDNASTSKSSPVSVVGAQSFSDVFAGNTSSGALKANGSAWGWGVNASGQLGQSNNTTNTLSPKPVVASLFLFSVSSIAAGGGHSLAVDQLGNAWAWGLANSGQVGDNQIATNRSSPVSVVGAHSFVRVVASGNTSAGLKADGTVWTWGLGTSGQLGDNSTTTKSSPVSVVGAHSFVAIAGSGVGFVGLKANNGTAWTWGLGTNGTLGDNTTTTKSSPVSVVGAHSFIQVDAASNVVYGRKSDGAIWAWGLGTSGGLGDNQVATNRSSPVSVAGGISFSAMAANSGGLMGIRGSDNSAWAWGINSSFQVGDNSNATRSSPQAVYGAFSFVSFTSVHAGASHSVAVRASDGSAWAWGAPNSGQLGDNQTTITRSSPVSVVGAHSFTAIRGGGSHTVALKANNGTAWCWGLATSGQIGDNQIATNRSSPTSVVGGHSFFQVAACITHTIGLKADGTVWAWGLNSSGQLGDNSSTSRSSPTSVVGEHSFASLLSSGCQAAFTAAIKGDGSLWAWGDNSYGQLGDGTIYNKSSPISVAGGASYTEVSCGGSFMVAVTASGAAYGIGANYTGQLGDGILDNSLSPRIALLSYRPFSFSQACAGDTVAAALTPSGHAWAWGIGTAGQLGDDTIVTKSSPVSVAGKHSFVAIQAGTTSVVGIKADGSAWACGTLRTAFDYRSPSSFPQASSFSTMTTGLATYGSKGDGLVWAFGIGTSGEMGDLSLTTKSSPVFVAGTIRQHSFVQVAAQNQGLHTFYRKSDGSTWVTGTQVSSSLGDNSAVGSRSSPFQVAGFHSVISVVSSGAGGMFVKSDGSAWTWGAGAAIGDNHTGNRSSPTSVVGPHSFTTVLGAGDTWFLAMRSDGTAWAWGAGTNGQLGDNTATSRSTPTSIAGAHSFVSMSGGASHSVCLKADGTVWSMGVNTSGRLGDNTITTRSSPVSVVGAHSFVRLSAGGIHSLALKADGTCWAWGTATSGQVGDNQIAVSRSSPVSVVGAHSFIEISGGNLYSVGLKADGTVWCWGLAASGQLGDNQTATNRSSPVSVVGDHSFVAISAGENTAMALKADGTAWGWGANNGNQIGDGTITSRSSPVMTIGQVLVHSFTTMIGAGISHAFALKSDGTTWGWGHNTAGQLGDNTLTTKSSPVSVVGAHSFVFVTGANATGAATANHSLFLKADGSAWACGLGTSGQLGDNTTTTKSSPASVVGAHSFVFAAAGNVFSMGLKANNGSVWTWGTGSQGVLGDNTATAKSSPVSVVGGHSFVGIAAGGNHGVGLKADGSAWCWGTATSGQLGDNQIAANRSSPVSVVGNHSFIQVAAGTSHTLGLKADGTCWGWGSSFAGQLGDGLHTTLSASTKSSPIRVCGFNSFTAIAAKGDRSAGIRYDGSIYAWGSTVEMALNKSTPWSVARLVY